MKRVSFLLVIIAFITTSVFAKNNEDVIYIKSVKFATPLLEQWIAEYSKLNPEVQFAIADKDTPSEEVDIRLLSSDAPSNNTYTFSIGRYAVLPIAGQNNTLLSEFQKKKLNMKRLKELFFEKELLDDEYEPAKDKYNATIYSVSNASSVSNTFANHFGYEISKLKGKKISGDDIFLINAVQKDNTGVSFNNLNYVFDINSRQLKANIVLLPLDLKKEYSEVIAEANLDKVIDLLENKSIDLIPVDEINFVVSNVADTQTEQFLQWVISEGQVYNHQYGFLNVDKETLAIQQKQVENLLLGYTK
jgi:ABC-type phosphate transport system substrate-binding protein